MKTKLKSARLRLLPMSRAELEAAISGTEESEQRGAYTEAAAALREKSGREIWYTVWKIELLTTGENIGYFRFGGYPNEEYETSLELYLKPGFRGSGYASEALLLLSKWAFSQRDCYYLRCETLPGDGAAHRVLTKNGFCCIGAGRKGPLYEAERPKEKWSTIFLCLGIAVGISVGTALDNVALSMSGGMIAGLLIGGLLEQRDKAHRKKPPENFFDGE